MVYTSRIKQIVHLFLTLNTFILKFTKCFTNVNITIIIEKSTCYHLDLKCTYFIGLSYFQHKKGKPINV